VSSLDARAFELLPAIDLRGGHVVRLVEGDFARETRYGTEPALVARDFAAAGARWLHVVDLDAAREARPVHAAAISAIVEAVGDGVGVEVAGGIRTGEAAGTWLAAGARRVVLGTAILADPALASALVADHGPDRSVAALDIRHGRAMGHAWATGTTGPVARDALERLADAGVDLFEVTAIARDGTLAGPDVTLLGDLVAAGRGRIIASGGIGSIGDLEAVIDVGCTGAIVGRALYEGRMDLRAALAAVDAAAPTGERED
jgi:phosphoribosylformimino-5-aminoimidazole carboxamide ribotide isomerase